MNESKFTSKSDQNNDKTIYPSFFLGHGSPMNAIEENEFVEGLRGLTKTIPKPKAILAISAHWLTDGTFVTAMEHPPTIHDFGGFPKALFDVQYPAPGDPNLAKQIQTLVKSQLVQLDYEWGLDHGTWSVLKHIYPDANIPVVQLSLDYKLPPEKHLQIAKELLPLRKQGILIVASGNIVHNLRMVAWDRLNEVYGFDWVMNVNQKVKDWIVSSDTESLLTIQSKGKEFEWAIPTAEHFLPLLYTIGTQLESDSISFFNDKPVAGALTMTSVRLDSDLHES
ncbi:Catalytic LigB subunit of aromatic ring-opening dioxygenase [Leptospira biflexa serovar Patoc strain 'Patoc 1 (Ames)']|uniref:Putative enzyme with aromatic-ring-opening dioxygenase domain n=1 Tax=Leptospira biflexa serovar Patoc (strain Patoc 1 / ATCC 23582 / Paris) TaxID=456481 RepID=B0SK47_LEPBP|nr:4,5-DOPA dioxygenase extradiol [Leptospira biflexa]ABZ92592.1 Catalytic LigB subunit of aromatic ring-opening dioxygenase [Leptospira biflexa serovar Patoc strain 'Patoc 1 (Ames)']ABZ96190.1 Putative enzyme with aromatic-ring-opening dioxygenase domain [Leptospira biflexa serovar Patoc strain 'Patoc 1 (Paris)']TGM37539.1 4,5-DOPA dioxygenase extradiol [Leptospira biflexa]TGM40874.1 4,5-DOPA dioxygenase extradiol [Leptospira biflexa]